MKTNLFSIISSTTIVVLFSTIAISYAYRLDIAEISKLIIDEISQEVSEDVNLYHTAGGDVYVRIPKTQRGDVLERGSIIETFDRIAARIEFSAKHFLILGTGTARIIDCAAVMGGESCTMARFEGFQQGHPFWYIKKGAAWLNNIVVCDDRACVDITGTESYVRSDARKTTVVVFTGEVRVKARDAPQQVTVRQGEQTEVLSADRPPTPPQRATRAVVDDIYQWVKASMLVIRTPAHGTVTHRPSIRLVGAISDETTHEVRVSRNTTPLDRVRVVDGAFVGDIALVNGENRITVQASSRYGKITDSISVTKVSSPPQPVPMPDLRGRAERAALNVLARHGFDTVKIIKQTTGRGRAGTVVDQSPAPNASVLLGTPVDLVVEEPHQQVRVPDVRGESVAEARRLLAEEGLSVGSVTQQVTRTGRAGTVVRQAPAPYTEVPPRTIVQLVVEADTDATMEAIDRIRGGPHAKMPSPTSTSAKTSQRGNTALSIQNHTGYTLQVHFGGPIRRTVNVPQGGSQEVELVAGRYQVAAEVSSRAVIPYYGSQTYKPNVRYQYTFFLRRR